MSIRLLVRHSFLNTAIVASIQSGAFASLVQSSDETAEFPLATTACKVKLAASSEGNGIVNPVEIGFCSFGKHHVKPTVADLTDMHDVSFCRCAKESVGRY